MSHHPHLLLVSRCLSFIPPHRMCINFQWCSVIGHETRSQLCCEIWFQHLSKDEMSYIKKIACDYHFQSTEHSFKVMVPWLPSYSIHPVFSRKELYNDMKTVPLCEFVCLSFSEVSWGDRGGPVVSHHRWAISSSWSPSSSFSICHRGPALSFQCPGHPCCLLTHTSLPARRHEAWRPVLLLFRRLRKGGWVWTRQAAKLSKAYVSRHVLFPRSDILVMNVRWKEAPLNFSFMIYFPDYK